MKIFNLSEKEAIMMNKRRTERYAVIMSVLMAICLWGTIACGQSATDYTIVWSTLDGGGGVRSGGNYLLVHSIGQSGGIGTFSTGQYTLSAGFYGTNIVSDAVAAQSGIAWDNGLSGVFPGDTIHYNLSVTNFFDSVLYFTIQDALDAYVDYLLGTLYVNDVQQSDNWFSEGLLDYQSDIVNPGETLFLMFDVQVSDLAPLDWMIENTMIVSAYSSHDPSSLLVTLVTDTTQTKVVPEASTLLLLGSGLLGVLALIRGKRNRRK